MTTQTRPSDPVLPPTAVSSSPTTPSAGSTGPLARVIIASMAAGTLAAAGLTAGALPGAGEPTIIGASLLGFATGWALLAVLTERLTTRPQRWARVPAAVMTAAGLMLVTLSPDQGTLTALGWVWPPALLALTVWMVRRTRRHLPRGQGRLMYPVLFALLLSAVGGAYQSFAQLGDADRFVMPGKLYDVGGYKLHLHCAGTGSPTVVLVGGLQETSPMWSRITPAVSATARVCSYDRPGQLWSEDSPHPADGDQAATDLHALLGAAHENGPYVLVGHSSGGPYALTYAARYPAEVVGMVLLDSSSPYQMSALPGFKGEYQMARRGLAVLPTLARLGAGQVLEGLTAARLPSPAAQQVAAFGSSPRGLRNMRAEQAALPDAFRQAQALTSLHRTPLVVLTAHDTSVQTAGWSAAQDRLATLSVNSRHQVLDLDHVALLDDRAGSACSARAITDVLGAVRSRTSPAAHR